MEFTGSFMFGMNSEAIMNAPDNLQEVNIGTALYGKPGYGLQLLRDEILGPERFDYAFKTYIERWAYKHPTPWDFFRDDGKRGGRKPWLVLEGMVPGELSPRPGPSYRSVMKTITRPAAPMYWWPISTRWLCRSL
jgi:hypothetical protein